MDVETRAKEILGIQASAINNLKFSGSMMAAIQEIVKMKNSGGRIITTGMGKAGIIATKMTRLRVTLGG